MLRTFTSEGRTRGFKGDEMGRAPGEEDAS